MVYTNTNILRGIIDRIPKLEILLYVVSNIRNNFNILMGI